ncbi:MAG: GntR family transcriptional regulator [Motiliproteus sp.]
MTITPKRISLRRRSLHEEIADHLRTMIIEGELAEGQRIDETALCGELDISRTPMREALKVLHSEGLVSIEPNRGARVATLTEQEFYELFEVISGLERSAAELAAERATDADLKRLQQLQTKMENHYNKEDRHSYFLVNQEIHRTIVAMAKNETLEILHNQLLNKASRGRYIAIGFDTRWKEALDEHQQLLEALKARNGIEAGQILFEHVRHTGSTALSAMKEKKEP